VSCQGIREDIFENFHFRGHFPLKSEIESRSNRHFTQSRLHVTEEFPRSVNLFVRRTVAELRGVKVAQFSDFGLSSQYETPKTYLPVTSLQPRGYIAE